MQEPYSEPSSAILIIEYVFVSRMAGTKRTSSVTVGTGRSQCHSHSTRRHHRLLRRSKNPIVAFIVQNCLLERIIAAVLRRSSRSFSS
jgi:hypothetical protein